MPEKMGYHLDSKWTPQSARLWTETSPNSKLNNINKRLNSLKGDKVDKLKELIQKREYVKFQNEIGLTSSKDADGKLGKRTFDSLNNYLNKLQNEKNLDQNLHNQLNNLSLSIGGTNTDSQKPKLHDQDIDTASAQFRESLSTNLQNISDNMRITRASKKYLSNYETLSQDQYDSIFSGKEKMGQGQLGDCYLISGLMELANTQYFDTLMRTSLTRVRFKDDGSLGYDIKIPLGEPNGRDILIKDSEINMAKIRGNIGYKILELAYVKNRRPNSKEGNKYSPVTEGEIQKITGGLTREVLEVFLGRHNIGFSDFGTAKVVNSGRTLSSLSQPKLTEIENYLKNFNGKIGNNFTDLFTAPSKNGDRDHFSVGGNILYNQHAYALSSVDKDPNGNISYVNVKNPRNNELKAGGSEIKLSLNEFFYAFSYIGVSKIKTRTFLDDKGVSYA